MPAFCYFDRLFSLSRNKIYDNSNYNTRQYANQKPYRISFFFFIICFLYDGIRLFIFFKNWLFIIGIHLIYNLWQFCKYCHLTLAVRIKNIA